MKKPQFFVPFLLCVFVGCAAPDSAVVDRVIIGEVMMHSEFKECLRALSLPHGRLSGTEGGAEGERIIAEKLREYGLKNVHFEEFEMPGWRVNSTEVTALTDPPLVCENPVALWMTEATPAEGITADLIDAGKGGDEDFEALGDKIKGKFVIVTGGKRDRYAKMRMALENGALGMLFTGHKDREPVIGGCHREPRPECAVAIRYDDGVKLSEMLSQGEAVRVNVKIDADFWDAKPRNVVGEIPGVGPRAHELVILGAHLDSWHLGEGAIDNGNGSATILETARALAAVGWRPKRTVRFVWFMGEEQGLLGSKAYAAAHQDEMKDTVVMINLDMPGRPLRFVSFGQTEVCGFLQSVARDLRGFEIEEAIGQSSGPWSDHWPFLNAGVRALTLSGELGDGSRHYHTIGDKYEVVDRRGTVLSSAVTGVLLRRLSDDYVRPTKQESAGE